MEANKQDAEILEYLVGEMGALRAECEDEEGIDVRLQIHDGDALFHYGPSDYDQDHRGYWGASSVGRDYTDAMIEASARDMIEQARDQEAMAESARAEGSVQS